MTDATSLRGIGRRARPWVALLLPPLAWYAFELGLATALRLSCSTVGSWLGVGWGAGSIASCVVAAMLAWPIARDEGDRTPTGPWIAALARLGAVVFALAIAFQTAATLIIPSCGR